jgi:glycosyltransferase involved in cell wall biosynthesis
VGCEGLAAVDGDNILIRDNPKDFADAVLAVLEDGTLRRRLGERGRATVEQIYSWDVIGREMLDAYLAVINERFEPRTFDRAITNELRCVNG